MLPWRQKAGSQGPRVDRIVTISVHAAYNYAGLFKTRVGNLGNPSTYKQRERIIRHEYQLRPILREVRGWTLKPGAAADRARPTYQQSAPLGSAGLRSVASVRFCRSAPEHIQDMFQNSCCCRFCRFCPHGAPRSRLRAAPR